MNQATVTADDARHRSSTAAGRLHGLLAEYEDFDAMREAAARVRDAGFTRWDAHSPFPVHGMDEAMGVRMTKLPWIVFLCGLAGASIGLGLQWFTNAFDYPFLISGKPYFSLPAFIPVTFELTILLSAFGAVLGMLALNSLPTHHNPLFNSERFRRVTDDRFFIYVEAADPRFELARAQRLLESSGAANVERIIAHAPARPPQWMARIGLLLLVLLMIPPALVAKARYSKSSEPRIHPVQDMDNQERYKAQQANPLFADGRASRLPVPGTIARGELRSDSVFYTGMTGGQWAATFPVDRLPAGEPLLLRGQNRFGIYCAPCHGMDGGGRGAVTVRAEELGTPLNVLSLHDPTVRARPDGHIFNTISNGIRTMPPYGDQIPEADRWAIVAYVRALQRSTSAKMDDVPAERRSELR